MSDAPLRVLIVDDEPLARRGLRVRLERMSGIEIVGECQSGGDAVAAIDARSPDLVLLDVQMPEVDGFDVIDAVGADRMPVTIFITAHDAHAIRAFDANALDYLLKPVDDERFARSVERARARVAERDARAREREMGAVLAAAPKRDTRIVLRDRGRVLVLEHRDIDWISAEGDYVRVYAGGRGYLVRHTMTAMEARLDASAFARIHRSAIVNVGRVREVRPHGDRDYTVVLRDDTKLKMSRSFRDRLTFPT
ncbi:MAG: LytR/AlgR family response regulator transcription factor [bacterium]